MKIKAVYTPHAFYDIPEEELEKAIKTAIGKPVRYNFQGPQIGTVIGAEYKEGKIEFEMDLPEISTSFSYKEFDRGSAYGITFHELSFDSSKQTRTDENE